jgi:glutamyl-Q tRNA(Asp) synthetase
MDDYRAALERLGADGLTYRCFKTRSELLDESARAPHGPVAPYVGSALPEPEEARRLAAGEPFAWRLSLRAAKDRLGAGFDALDFVEEGSGPNGEHGRLGAAPDAAGDVILARKGLGVAYHLAVVVDDALQGVDCVVRGADLFDAVPAQRLLQALLELPAPVYRHHAILLGPDGRRYAKRDQAETLRALRANGLDPAALRAELGFD